MRIGMLSHNYPPHPGGLEVIAVGSDRPEGGDRTESDPQ